MSIVMGLDQHRGQITGEWIDTDTGEVQRARVAPADRAHVRKWLSRFRGRELEVALEATTGWRFVVEELRRVGAVVHLAEPAETAGLRGPKKRAKGDRADARHLRELLMIERLPESEPAMSTDRVRQANLAAITCEPRPHLPAGFRRHSNRLGASPGAARTGLSVYELPPGQAIGPYHFAMFSSMTAVGAVIYPDSDMIQVFTSDGTDDIVVERKNAVDVTAPWSIEHPDAHT